MPEEPASACSVDIGTGKVHLTPCSDFSCHHPVSPRAQSWGQYCLWGLVNSLPRRDSPRGVRLALLVGSVLSGGPSLVGWMLRPLCKPL